MIAPIVCVSWGILGLCFVMQYLARYRATVLEKRSHRGLVVVNEGTTFIILVYLAVRKCNIVCNRLLRK